MLKICCILATLVLTILFVGNTFAQSQFPAKNDEQKYAADSPQPNEQIAPVQTQSSQPHQTECQQHANCENAQPNGISNILIGIAQTAALVITFGVIAFVGIKQLRAYVYAVPVYLFSFDTKSYPRVRFRVFNSGVTPAYNLVHRAQIGILDHPPQPGMSLEPISGNWSAPMSLHRGGEPFFLMYTKDRKFTLEEINKLRAGTSRLYAYGEIRYRHAFRWPFHYTQFCHSVSEGPAVMKKITSAFRGEIKEIHFELAPMGNKAT